MGGQRISPIQVGAITGDGAQPTLLRRVVQLAGKIPAIQIFSVAMERDVAGIERKDAGNTDKYRAHLCARPVICPAFDVEDRGIMLGEVRLPNAATGFVLGWVR